MSAGLFGKKRRRGEQDFYLQITSMIDTLVIILVFMLMTIGSGNINIEPASGITLPWSAQGAELTQGLKIVAKTDGIYVEEEKIIPIVNGAIAANNLSEDSKKIIPLFQKLSEKARESRKVASDAGSKVKFEGRVLFQADKVMPLKLIRQVLYTAARAGFNDFKFAVIRQ